MGFTYHLQGQLHKAIEYYHKALGIKSDDTVASDLLDRALREEFEAVIKPTTQRFEESLSSIQNGSPSSFDNTSSIMNLSGDDSL